MEKIEQCPQKTVPIIYYRKSEIPLKELYDNLYKGLVDENILENNLV